MEKTVMIWYHVLLDDYRKFEKQRQKTVKKSSRHGMKGSSFRRICHGSNQRAED